MTIGMLIESMAGKSAASCGRFQDGTPFAFQEHRKAVDFFGTFHSSVSFRSHSPRFPALCSWLWIFWIWTSLNSCVEIKIYWNIIWTGLLGTIWSTDAHGDIRGDCILSAPASYGIWQIASSWDWSCTSTYTTTCQRSEKAWWDSPGWNGEGFIACTRHFFPSAW